MTIAIETETVSGPERTGPPAVGHGHVPVVKTCMVLKSPRCTLANDLHQAQT